MPRSPTFATIAGCIGWMTRIAVVLTRCHLRLEHDDGLGQDGLGKADIVLAGVSPTGKITNEYLSGNAGFSRRQHFTCGAG